MNMIPVNSTNLSAVGYDGEILRIQFRSGGLYEYYGVPSFTYTGLMNAASKGRYFVSFIKNKYPCIKIL